MITKSWFSYTFIKHVTCIEFGDIDTALIRRSKGVVVRQVVGTGRVVTSIQRFLV